MSQRSIVFRGLLMLAMIGGACSRDSEGDSNDSEETDDESADGAAGESADEDDAWNAAIPGCDVAEVEQTPGANWADSYRANGKCYCISTFDHGIGDVLVDTPVGKRTVEQVCNSIGPGPGPAGRARYNDVQCGNGPANNTADENYCPGRVDQGKLGCCKKGPKWDLTAVQ